MVTLEAIVKDKEGEITKGERRQNISVVKILQNVFQSPFTPFHFLSHHSDPQSSFTYITVALSKVGSPLLTSL